MKVEEMPNEILVKIFSHLNIRDLGRCSKVSHKFRHICYNETMWQKINLYGKDVPVEFIEHLFAIGTKYFSLQETKIYGLFEKLKTCELKYLNLSQCSAQSGICNNAKEVILKNVFMNEKL